MVHFYDISRSTRHRNSLVCWVASVFIFCILTLWINTSNSLEKQLKQPSISLCFNIAFTVLWTLYFTLCYPSIIIVTLWLDASCITRSPIFLQLILLKGSRCGWKILTKLNMACLVFFNLFGEKTKIQFFAKLSICSLQP